MIPLTISIFICMGFLTEKAVSMAGEGGGTSKRRYFLATCKA